MEGVKFYPFNNNKKITCVSWSHKHTECKTGRIKSYDILNQTSSKINLLLMNRGILFLVYKEFMKVRMYKSKSSLT